jgi:hypothetical protein
MIKGKRVPDAMIGYVALLSLIASLVFFCCDSSTEGQMSPVFPELKGEYLGQKKPGLKPELFAPGVISTGLYERDIAITPDGKEIFYGLAFGGNVTIMVAKMDDSGIWSEPVAASFASNLNYKYFEPCLSYDGDRMFFLSTLPKEGQEPKLGWAYQNIWAVDRGEDGSWGDPYIIGSPVSTDENEYYPSVTKSGTLYFSRSKKGEDKVGIYRSHYIDGKYAEPEPLPEAVNGIGNVYNAFIAHDESFLIGCVADCKNNLSPGFADYYLFFRDANDQWSGPVNMGPEINHPNTHALSAYVTRDGKYLFFASSKKTDLTKKRLTWSLIQKFSREALNGHSDIYWVDAKIIDRLKAKL